MTKKIPLRQCIACQEMKNKKELMRVVKQQDGSICLDLTGKLSGRGAYLCKNPACLKKAKKARRLEASLECEIPEAVFARLEEELTGAIES